MTGKTLFLYKKGRPNHMFRRLKLLLKAVFGGAIYDLLHYCLPSIMP